tara:strand:- start:247 stop:399 length:153 start_codon:yes stop_codon:yes gene_type:complete
MEERGWEFLVNITWPHNKFALGWEYFPVDDDMSYESIIFHLGFVTLIINF